MNGEPAAAESLPLIAIVGRPNVGKSALFNRIVGRRQALVQGLPGTTRDRNYADAEWRGRAFRVVDTGGLLGEQLEGPYADEVSGQVRRALEEADAICFVLDVQQGVLAADEDVAAILRGAAQPVYVVANKADNAVLATAAAECYGLGLGEPRALSAHHGLGVAELLDHIVEWLPRLAAPTRTTVCNLAIVGRPNVGKSSLVNSLLQEERMIVSAVPGTTRDAVDTPVIFDGKRIVLVDTAGIRRRGRVQPGVEKASVRRARAAVGRADVVAVLLDGGEEIAAQDQHIIGIALEAGTGIVLVVNKTDLLRGDAEGRERRRRQLRWRTRFVSWAPVVWTSALDGENLDELLRTAITVAAERRRRVSTAEFNALIQRATLEHPPATVRGRPIKFFYASQVAVEPPTFVFFVTSPQDIHFSYERYLQRRIRAEFGFLGSGLRLILRARGVRRG